MDRTMMDRTMMDRTMMDRTNIMINNYRAEEKELSDKIHIKIETLNLINAPDEEFKKIFVKDMFLKSNPKAFFPTMHYIFVTLDPIEFKKRFYWPIIDKRSETNFRSSTVEYLNYLNKKHNLQSTTQLTNYLVLMPGGFKFLTFLNDFLDFIAGELVKQREKYLLEKVPLMDLNVNKINFNKLKQQREFLKENSLRYCQSLEERTKKLKEKINILCNVIVKISKITKIPMSHLMDVEFIETFLQYGKDLIKKKISKKVDELVSTENNIVAIEEDIKIYQKQKSEISFDRNKLTSTFSYIKMKNPKLLDNILCGNELNLEMLLKIFEHIIPEFQNLLSTLDQNLLDQLIFEEDVLSKRNSELMQLDNDITKYSTSLYDDIKSHKKNINIKTTPMRCLSNKNNNLLSKFIYTPPLQQFNNLSEGNIKMRLSLMDDYNTKDISMMHLGDTNSVEHFSFANNQTTLLPMKTPKTNSKNRNNSTLNRSKIMDASDLLRILTKPKQRIRDIDAITNQSIRNLSPLAMNWKGKNITEEEMKENNESLFDCNKTIHSKILLNTMNKNQKTPDIKKKLYFEPQQNFLKLNNSPKNMVVQQVQNTALDFSKLSTSPSGRLESLIKINHNSLPKILLNDLSMNLSMNEQTNDVENDFNISTFDIRLNISNTGEKDCIFNVSDSILKDIPM